MVPLSRQYAPHVAAILLLPLVPVAIHSYGKLSANDCAEVDQFLAHAGPRQDRSGRNEWMDQQFSAVKWQEGSPSLGSALANFNTAVIVSQDAKKLYHHPETALVRSASADRRGVEWIQAGDEKIPIHRVYYDRPEQALMAAYLLVYDSRPVANPYTAQFAAFGTQLVRGRLPMTLFFISASGRGSEAVALEQQMYQWLGDAWRQYRAVCLN